MRSCLTLVLIAAVLPLAAPAQPKEAKELINKEAEKAIDAALGYLAKEQHDDGSFGTAQYTGEVGITSLGGLALLSRKRGVKDEDFDKAVDKAVRFVLKQEDKDTAGFFHNRQAAVHGPMYGHGFAMLFLADAHAASKDKKLQKEIKDALERAVKLLLNSQSREGGWRYQPRSADADISVTACQVLGLRAARDLGIDVPKANLDKAIDYIKRCQDPNSGGYRYQSFGGAPGFARTSAGLASLNRLGVKDGDAVKKGMDYVQKQKGIKAFEWEIHYSYGHYYAAKTMWYAGDREWQAWYPAARDELLKSRKDDHFVAPKMKICAHYDTAVALIVLQMPHQQLASLRR